MRRHHCSPDDVVDSTDEGVTAGTHADSRRLTRVSTRVLLRQTRQYRGNELHQTTRQQVVRQSARRRYSERHCAATSAATCQARAADGCTCTAGAGLQRLAAQDELWTEGTTDILMGNQWTYIDLERQTCGKAIKRNKYR